MKRTIVSATALLVILAVAGSAQAQRRGRIIIRPQTPPAHGQTGRYIDVDYPTPEKRAANLAELLSLTAEQKQKVEAIFVEQDKRALALWTDQSLARDAREKKIEAVRDTTMKIVRDLLTEEQKKKYDAIGANDKPAD